MKRFIKIMALLAVLGTVFASVFMAVEVSHECIGEDCPICAAISLFRHLTGVVFLITLCLVPGGLLSCMNDCRFAHINELHNTPVSLKVKLID